MGGGRAWRGDWIRTPRPEEAARLLRCRVAEVEEGRFAAVRRLQESYGGVCLLKGAGTLIASGNPQLHLCSDGNPGMASPGMGDLLSGLAGALVAQGLSLELAALHAVCLHAAAGDLAARDGEKGMLASDLLPAIRSLLNPEVASC